MTKSKYVVFIAIGFELVGLVLAGLLFGQSIDATYNLEGIATTAGILLALVVWIVHLLVLIKNLEAE